MASLSTACRATARAVASRSAIARGFTTSTRCLAAQNFTMPALSPTMTEGNIATWKVKEGESFSAGDVLLEIETDKASMDVEAQDDGIMFKIMVADGSKAVQVGSRIGVIAEAGDDINSLEVPADEQAKEQPKEQSSAQAPRESTAPSQSKPAEKTAKPAGNETYEHKYPLLPSVGHLIKEKGLSEADVAKIKGTGPHGRLVKGDILAHIGSINPETPVANEVNFNNLFRLDLSNIKVATKPAPPSKPVEDVKAEAPKAPVVEDLEVSIPITLTKVIEVQNRIHETLGVFLPLSTFVGRAAEVANDDLPPTKRAPTADELFDQVLGLDKVKAVKGSRGVYLPQISAISPTSLLSPRTSARKQTDIIDILAAPSKKSASKPATVRAVPGLSSGANVFSLVVPKAEEERAQLFLERCKVILEEEPGRLVL
ncbi:related to pyruvate dehydrogenase complex protein X precursor, dihydrolipoamide acetyltransferase comp [Fusarium torulosum]|uniref:Related to pyruvate dehydrogenase complex protein X, dihydrolipoamide acetyltransferase comp n=1 Tax=Fusarium torulosum TaxID=33205 RepID=A0AAE8MCJ6_9HYPO|nr:related to pyruvate dehydrogenase complex protein X precursor, dihydrolipoamide acetyltransferase comp [Fusarium torulosum]